MPNLESYRTGNLIRQPSGYDAFIPHKLAENDLKVKIDSKMIQLISEADRTLTLKQSMLTQTEMGEWDGF
ncbi:MAG: hypothetical protein KC713_01700 [Candidatus Omnitrophica bacterium]|nr:hypothetical protein [Candidatus Omnitrophota bacterium]